MIRSQFALGAAAALVLGTAPASLADAPRVATDILPVHSLVAQVMEGVGAPDLLFETSASPHDAALRPSRAQMLQDAELIVWVGEELSPALARAVAALSGAAQTLGLLDLPGVHVLGFRDGPLFHHAGNAGHVDGPSLSAHADHRGHAAGEDHAAHHDHDAAEGHTDHGTHEDHAAHHGHGHSGRDPHAWLDPANAEVWVAAIAERLSAMDPANAATYSRNAARAQARINAAATEASLDIARVQERTFLVFHDAYHYFEHRFGIEAAGAIALGDAAAPSAARLSEIRDFVAAEGVACIFSEPQFDPALAETIAEGTETRIATLDPLGSALEPGPDAYFAIITGMAADLAACLDPAT